MKRKYSQEEEILIKEIYYFLLKNIKIFIICGILGFFFGTLLYHHSDNKFETDLYFYSNIPVINIDYIIKSEVINEKLIDSKLNIKSQPKLAYQGEKKFTVTSTNSNFKSEINKLFINAIKQQKKDCKKLMLLENYSDQGYRNFLIYIDLYDIEYLLTNIKVKFGKTKLKTNSLIKHILIGFILSLFFAIFYILLFVNKKLVFSFFRNKNH